MEYNYEYFKVMTDYIKERINYETPELGIILGSALGPFAEQIENPIEIDYGDIPNFLMSTVQFHAGKLIYGTIEGKKVLCMSGRFHSYEGYFMEQLVIPIRMFKLMDVKAVILTNASGAVNESYKPGDVMIVTDHIKLTGNSPLSGMNVEEFGSRFFDVTNMYTKEYIELAKRCGEGTGLTIHEGVYMFFKGPQFETPAEIRAARILGADVVGMSTVTEALTAAHCGLPILCISVITNMAAGISSKPLSHHDVAVSAEESSEAFTNYIRKIVREM